MALAGQRKCLCCSNFFEPDARNRRRQRYCCAADCRRASKAASQTAWLAQPDNREYFRDPVHGARVRAWRAAHPGYSRGSPRPAPVLQDSLIAQVPESVEESGIHTEIPAAPPAAALQDLFSPASPALTGLVAHLFDLALQEDIAAVIARLVQRGHDVINRGGHETSQASLAARAAAPGTPAVQLG